jgi:hypothetical protein
MISAAILARHGTTGAASDVEEVVSDTSRELPAAVANGASGPDAKMHGTKITFA